MQAPFIRDADGSERQGETVKAGSGWGSSIGPIDLTFIRVDHQVRLQFDDTEIVIESPFVLQTGGIDHLLDPERRAELGPLLRLYPDVLSSTSVDADGTLRLNFASGANIAVRADPHYEAGQVNSPDGFLVVCVPGNAGELSIWR